MTFWGRQSTNKSIQFKTFRTNPEHAILILPMCWGLVSNHMFMHSWRSGRSDMLCSLICIPVHQWKHNSSTAPHVCYRELISIWRAASLGWDTGAKTPLSLSLSSEAFHTDTFMSGLCRDCFASVGRAMNKALTKEYISILMLSDRCVQNWDFRGYIWLTR